MDELDGQVAIVTGGGRGIGRAVAQAFAAAGAAVALAARSPDQLQDTLAAITQAGGRALAVPTDVTDPAAVAALVAETERRLGPIDVLVNNAGIAGPIGPIWEVDAAAWQRCVAVNLVGPFLCAQAVLPGMLARRRGRIINVASAHALGPFPFASGYNITKTALVRLTETLAEETKPHGITVFTLDPAFVTTQLTETVVARPEWKKWITATPATAVGLPHVAAECPAALCVRLAAGVADALSGRFIRVQDDLDTLLQQAVEIQEHDLYRLRLRM